MPWPIWSLEAVLHCQVRVCDWSIELSRPRVGIRLRLCASTWTVYPQYWQLFTTCTIASSSVPGKRPLQGKNPCIAFQGATVAASIQTYGILIPGKCPCRPKSQITFKHPWVLSWDIMVCSYWGYHWTAEQFHVDIVLLFPPIRNHPSSSHTIAAPSHRHVERGYVCILTVATTVVD